MSWEDLAYIQNHGGLMLMVLLAVIMAATVRAIDWFVWHRELKEVSRKASEDVGQHELNYHLEEVLVRANTNRNRRAEDKLNK